MGGGGGEDRSRDTKESRQQVNRGADRQGHQETNGLEDQMTRELETGGKGKRQRSRTGNRER